MSSNFRLPWTFVMALGAQLVFFAPRTARAHCDTLDGPVVTAARLALDRGDPTPVLRWVKKEDEPEIRAAFQKSLAARKAGPEAREVADLWFFETLVRVHRAGEGAPYTGLKPARRAPAPGCDESRRAPRNGGTWQQVAARARVRFRGRRLGLDTKSRMV